MVLVTIKSPKYAYHNKYEQHSVTCCIDCNDYDGCLPEERICCPRCKFFGICEEMI